MKRHVFGLKNFIDIFSETMKDLFLSAQSTILFTFSLFLSSFHLKSITFFSLTFFFRGG